MIPAVLFVTVLIDVRTHKIPNIILILLLLIQVLSRFFQTIAEGFSIDLEDLIPRYLTVILIFVILYFFFSIGTLGAGDVKLITLIALSVTNPLKFVLLTFITGSVLAIFQMLRNGNSRKRLKMLTAYICNLVCMGRAIPYYFTKDEPSEKKKYSVHLSIPIFIAYMILEVLPLWI
ncbi:MAG: A24 family peptidase [Lachnospiraceae bacterium]|nr:A24 family peptidase [Lachnospiraceae bacterium]